MLSNELPEPLPPLFCSLVLLKRKLSESYLRVTSTESLGSILVKDVPIIDLPIRNRKHTVMTHIGEVGMIPGLLLALLEAFLLDLCLVHRKLICWYFSKSL